MKLVFVVPCHGRHPLAAACLRQLRRTCDELANTIEATAVIVGDDQRFRVLASQLDFAYVRAANSPLGRKWNDGYEHACRRLDADVCVPFGSDDAIDAAFIADGGLPAGMEMRCARESTVVAPGGRRMAHLRVTSPDGDGVRLMPRALLERLGFRPALDERERAIDGSITDRIRERTGRRPQSAFFDLHPLQIVDFKSDPGYQLNTYEACRRGFGVHESSDVWAQLGRVYPGAFLEEVAASYRVRLPQGAAA